MHISTAPAQFSTCPHRDNDTTCTESQPKVVALNESVVFDTAAIFHLNMSGPCQLNQSAFSSQLFKEGAGGPMFECFISEQNANSECKLRDRVKVNYNIDGPGDSNTFNFKLELMNVQLNDSGTYRYEAEFNFLAGTYRKIIKFFTLNVSEFAGEWISTQLEFCTWNTWADK